MESGFLLINKPKDWTSHDVVAYLRGVTKIKKIGHAGTLDPFATGLLIVGVGREATKRLDEFKELKKEYIATIQLGAVSDTYDSTGEIKKIDIKKQISEKDIKKTLEQFVGKQEQIPPMYSAKKVGGKKLYELARKGIEIERKPCEIEIFSIDCLECINDELKIKVSSSPGTYIRTLAHDIGQALGTGAYCEELERTGIGEYTLEHAVGPKELTNKNWQKRLFL